MTKITVGKRCPMCQTVNTVEVNNEDYVKWENGTVCQVAFPYLNANEREILISGICPTCWDKMFNSETSEEDEDFEDENWEDEEDWEDEFEGDLEDVLDFLMGGEDEDPDFDGEYVEEEE